MKKDYKELKESVLRFFKGSKLKPIEFKTNENGKIRVIANVLNKDVDKFESSFIGIEIRVDKEEGTLVPSETALRDNDYRVVKRFIDLV